MNSRNEHTSLKKSVSMNESQIRGELSRAIAESRALVERIATLGSDISRYDAEMARAHGIVKERDATISFQARHVDSLEALLAQGGHNVDERYILKSESDALLEALTVIKEMERRRREQSMSYMTELSNNMRQFNTE